MPRPLHPQADGALLPRLVRELAPDKAAIRDGIDLLCDQPFAELDDCAAATGCARRTLQRAFAQAGLRFLQLRQAARLTLAEPALRQGQQPLTEIAHGAGFCDSAHVAHAWRRSCGLTPAQYRALCQDGSRELSP